MPSVLSSCPSCRRVRRCYLENLGQKSRCSCGTTFVLAEWKCSACGQPLKTTRSQCPRCLTDIESPQLSEYSSGLENGSDLDTADREDEFNEDQQNIPESSNLSENDDLAFQFLNESVEPEPAAGNYREGRTWADSANMNSDQSDVSTHHDHWRQEQESAYAREQELIAEKARQSRDRLRADRPSNPVGVQESSPVNKSNGGQMSGFSGNLKSGSGRLKGLNPNSVRHAASGLLI